MGIPWKIKRKNQESHGDDMPCVMQNEGVPKEAASCDVKTKKILIREVKRRSCWLGLCSVKNCNYLRTLKEGNILLKK